MANLTRRHFITLIHTAPGYLFWTSSEGRATRFSRAGALGVAVDVSSRWWARDVRVIPVLSWESWSADALLAAAAERFPAQMRRICAAYSVVVVSSVAQTPPGAAAKRG
ncbi:MAG: hypothetical protein QUS11_04095 [Candidatus Fermentibacter sp.]|nr:hypothetical protein [Candidatus Fermentibacter sp.]